MQKKKSNRILCVLAAVIVVCAALVLLITEGVRLNRQKKNAFAYEVEVGDTIFFGVYEQDDDPSDGKEEIAWMVLAKEDQRILVLSRCALDCRKYHESFYCATWETCSLREWLNEDFLTEAFREEERSRILPVKISAEPNPEYNTEAGNDTQDLVFLLSAQEVERYLPAESERICEATAYAVSQGVLAREGQCRWWLRMPGRTNNYAAEILNNGSFNYYGSHVGFDFLGVRPAMWIETGS